MRLIVDASSVVAEVLRARGRALLLHDALDLAIAEETWGETIHEVSKRVPLLARSWDLDEAGTEQVLDSAIAIITAAMTVIPPTAYAGRTEEALWRIPRDPNDAPSVALALALECGIWTHDRDFFGCGIPVWSSEVLERHLELTWSS